MYLFIAMIDEENTLCLLEHVNPLFPRESISREWMCCSLYMTANTSFPLIPLLSICTPCVNFGSFSSVWQDRRMLFGLPNVKQDDLPFSISSSIMQNLLAIIFHCMFLLRLKVLPSFQHHYFIRNIFSPRLKLDSNINNSNVMFIIML